ncbi:MAG: CDP-alcohol phosphatidyltransferase family protein [Gemmatimonadota bacterium]
MNLPNAITILRVALVPLVAWLLFQPSPTLRVLSFVVFLAAALSDLVDGSLARSRGEITNLGKLIDPIADKLLLTVTLISFFILTRGDPGLGGIPLFGGIATWVLVVFIGREAIVTALRGAAAHRGVVVAAGPSGKRKALAQNVFLGAMILWIAYRTAAALNGWTGTLNGFWRGFHGWFTTISLLVALALTVYSLAVYLAVFRRVLSADPGADGFDQPRGG